MLFWMRKLIYNLYFIFMNRILLLDAPFLQKLLSGQLLTTERLTICTHVMEFCSTMRAPEEEKHLSPGKSQDQWLKFILVN